jgi:hypothetical protein
MSKTQHCFRGAAGRLHLLHGEPVLILTCPPVDPTADALGRPGEITAVVHIAAGQTWPDRTSETLADAALQQGGAVALVFADLGDAMACMRRIGQDSQA